MDKRNAAPNCQCAPGYFEEKNHCFPCKLPCATCTSEKVCITFECNSTTSGLYLFTPANEGSYDPAGCDSWPLLK